MLHLVFKKIIVRHIFHSSIKNIMNYNVFLPIFRLFVRAKQEIQFTWFSKGQIVNDVHNKLYI